MLLLRRRLHKNERKRLPKGFAFYLKPEIMSSKVKLFLEEDFLLL